MMKKRLLCASIAFTVFAASLSGCTNANKPVETTESLHTEDTNAVTGEDTSLTYITEKGEFILGFDNAFPPMGFLDDSQENIGFDLDVAAEVAKRMGVTLTLNPISWKAKEQELASKNIDCIWNGFSVNEDRKKNLTLSDSYMLNRQVVVTLIDNEMTTLKDLSGKKVVIQNGSTAQDAVDSNKEFKSSLGELVQVENNIQAMLDLKIGGTDAVVMDEVVARYYMNLEVNAGQYKVLDESLSDEEYAIGFRKGDDALSSEINKILKEMASDGTLSTISMEWFAEDITIIKP